MKKFSAEGEIKGRKNPKERRVQEGKDRKVLPHHRQGAQLKWQQLDFHLQVGSKPAQEPAELSKPTWAAHHGKKIQKLP